MQLHKTGYLLFFWREIQLVHIAIVLPTWEKRMSSSLYISSSPSLSSLGSYLVQLPFTKNPEFGVPQLLKAKGRQVVNLYFYLTQSLVLLNWPKCLSSRHQAMFRPLKLKVEVKVSLQGCCSLISCFPSTSLIEFLQQKHNVKYTSLIFGQEASEKHKWRLTTPSSKLHCCCCCCCCFQLCLCLAVPACMHWISEWETGN